MNYPKNEEQVLSPQVSIVQAELSRLRAENRFLRLKNDGLLIEVSRLEKKLREINGA